VKDFEYAAPTSLDEATALLARANGSARVLAGGTDLLVQLRENLRDADLVVDLKRIPQLMELTYSREAGLKLGAAVPCWRIYEHAEVAAAYPALADAAHIVGGWQIQSRASVGGNLCNSSPAGDTIPPLIALAAKCVAIGPRGSREIPAEHFCVAPGRNVLERGEILANIVFPPPTAMAGSAYERFIPRNEMDIAVAGAASWVKLAAGGDIIEEARIGLAAVAPKPLFAVGASRWLAGKTATDASFTQAGELARNITTPISDMRGTSEFRLHLVGVLVKRTLARAVERARANSR
jgi:carbon-monoxide dehydrogenase medium subunit